MRGRGRPSVKDGGRGVEVAGRVVGVVVAGGEVVVVVLRVIVADCERAR